MSQLPPHSLLPSHVILSQLNKNISVPFCTQREPKSLCSWTTVVLHCADGLLLQQTKPSDTHRQYTKSILMGFMENEFSEMWNISSPLRSSVCLSVCCVQPLQFSCVWIVRLTFRTMCKFSVNPVVSIMMKLGAVRHYVCCLWRCLLPSFLSQNAWLATSVRKSYHQGILRVRPISRTLQGQP
jgi:hypothetical protein